MPELFQVVTVADATTRLLAHSSPLPRFEEVALHDALGLVVAVDLHSSVDLPAFTRSTMDGFAVRAADTYGASEGLPAYLTLVGEVPMGRASDLTLGSGEAARVHTGGMLPAGSDAVVMVEHTQLLDERLIEVVRPVGVGENSIPLGDDIRQADRMFARGQRLRPQDLGGLAGVGITSVPVLARPRVAILATGDEIISPDQQPALGQIRDINSSTIAALVARAGGVPLPCGIAPDDAAQLYAMAAAALADADLLVISAGSSVSTRDMTAQVIDGLGKPGVLVHGVAMHPGKPTILAVADGKAVFGLPGNPVSTVIAFELFVKPAIETLLAIDQKTRSAMVQRAILGHNIASHPGVEDFVPVRLEQRDDSLWAVPVFGKSNLIYTLVRAHGLVAVPLDRTGLYAGHEVKVRLF